MTTTHLDTTRHPITNIEYIADCRQRLDREGALVLEGFAPSTTIAQIVAESAPREPDAYYTDKTHNVYLTPVDPNHPDDHPYNRQVASSKGLIADDEIPAESALREIYNDLDFRRFLCGVLGIDEIHPYADDLSSINVRSTSSRVISCSSEDATPSTASPLPKETRRGSSSSSPTTSNAASHSRSTRSTRSTAEPLSLGGTSAQSTGLAHHP